MIRVAMLSYWHVHADDYTRQALDHPDTEIVAVWDENAERGRAKASQLNVPFVESLDELLARPDIDAVVNDSPSSMHRDVMVKAAKAGKHIFTEKVVAPTYKEANEIVQAARDAGVVLTVSLRRMNESYCPPAREIVEKGLLGDLTLVRIRDAHNGATGAWLVEHFFNKAETHGGALIDLGCHPMYLTRLFLGMPESVIANYGYVTGREVEDNAVAVLRYPTGALGVVETGFVTGVGTFSMELCGTHGTLTYSAQDNRLLLRTTKEGLESSKEWVSVPLRSRPSAFEQWVSHIQNGTTDAENTEISVDLSRLMEASNLSAAHNRPVAISELQA